jgi:hypothetical protein
MRMSSRPLLLALALVLTSAAASAHEPANAPPEVADSAFVKAKVKLDGKSFEHPGLRIDHETESVLTIEAGGKTHEIVVTIESKEGKTYKVDAEYLRNGHSVEKVEDLVVPEKKYVMVADKFGLWIDPFGQPDQSRKGKIKGPKGEDPLG